MNRTLDASRGSALSLTRVLVVDDDFLVAEVLSSYLRSMWCCDVSLVTDVGGALSLSEEQGPWDLVLADFRLPGASGLPFIRELSALNSPNPVVVMSGKIGPHAAQAVYTAGARGFISKQTGAAKMLRRLEVVLKGEIYVPPEILLEQLPEASGGEDVRLSFREQEVLNGVGEGLSNKEIARELGLSDITIKLYVRSILRKLGLSNRTQLAMMDKVNVSGLTAESK
jgi:DNA-binding NarL/FixJ family response regulator